DKNDMCQVIIKRKGTEQKCGKEYTYDELISNMITHLYSDHSILNNNKLKSEIKHVYQTKLPDLINNNIPHKKTKQLENNRVVMEWIVLDNELFTAPQKKGFCRMMAVIDLKFCPPSNHLIMNDLLIIHL
ncbi:3491_t:CDS:2, partial [Scutellospora calospora]